MAIKERLLKQLNIVRDGLNAMPPFHSRDLNAMRNALVQARDLCFQGLPEKSFAAYKDTYDGLLLAIDQLAANAPDQGEIVSLCSELLQYTITQNQKETTFKKEIFFLPYKASMWDSLESVWRAADEDKEHCIAYVMPIPYADLTPEHTVAEWHCERDLFPKDVPTVDWQTVDLAEVHPDVIFIHNPYDEYNRVTSVESRYYSTTLKDQTDKLVYIPYFVLEEPTPSDENSEKAVEGFVLTPAVMNAHQVIVQSEAMRQVYISVLTRKTSKNDRAFWEQRILGLGSPKFDKVTSTKKEDLDIPKEWLEIINKADGTWKKIIFYNTGLSAMLQYDVKMMVKIRQVFQIFKEKKDEIALLWRPHPLIPATIQSMRPQLVEEYAKLVRRFKEEGWGIYDDSADIDRAIILSDAYYGDESSVLQMYQKTGKPIMLQDVELIETKRKEYYETKCSFIGAYHKTDGRVIFWDSYHSAIQEYDVVNKKISFLKYIEFQYGVDNIYDIGNYFYVVSKNKAEISVFDQEFNLTKIYSMNEYANYVSMAYAGNIYGIPVVKGGKFYRFDCRNKQLVQYEQLFNFINSIDAMNRRGLFVGSNDNIISFPLYGTDIIIIWRLTEGIIKAIHTKSNYRLSTCICDGHGIWAVQCDSPNIIFWDIALERFTKIIHVPLLINRKLEPYSNLLIRNNYLIILPRGGTAIVVLNRTTMDLRLINIPKDLLSSEENAGSLMYGFHSEGDMIHLYPNISGKYHILDLKSMSLTEREFFVSENQILKNFSNSFMIDKVLKTDNRLILLIIWLYHNHINFKIKDQIVACGKKIYCSVLKMHEKNIK